MLCRRGEPSDHEIDRPRRARTSAQSGAGAGLPLASLYHAAAGPEREKAALVRAIELTNGLMGTGAGIEVNVIAERLALVHRSVMPFLYALVRRRQAADDVSDLTLGARV